MAMTDFRARLQPKNMEMAKAVLGPNTPDNLLFPLHQTNGVIFPYKPTISTGATVEYDNTPFVHSNYGYNAFVRSEPKDIGISAVFTAQSDPEALYLLSVLHFFRSVTKMYFGVQTYTRSGTPPPVLIFNYLGQYQFNNVPVIINEVAYTLPDDVDYVPVDTSGFSGGSVPSRSVRLAAANRDGYTWVPTKLSLSITLKTQYRPITTRDQFNLDSFRAGKMVNKGYI